MGSRLRRLLSSLSSRLLLLTILFVMVVEVLVYVPSIANFRLSFLTERVMAAELAALSLVEAPGNMFSEELEAQLLTVAGANAIVLKIGGRSELILQEALPTGQTPRYDLREARPLALIGDAFATLAGGGDRVVQVIGKPSLPDAERIEIVLSEQALYEAMLVYSRNILILSIIISVATATLVFLSLHRMLVRPMRRVTESMIAFSERPDDPSSRITPSDRSDEIGLADRALAGMQDQISQALKQRTRLANLGAAVSKINHDLRNILATAQLSSDRLLRTADPKIREMSGRLISAIDRAISLCERTLRYGRADEPEPDKQPIPLKALVDDVGASLGLNGGGPVAWCNDVPDDACIYADRDQFFRVLLNLARNAARAVGPEGRIAVDCEVDADGIATIRMTDSGPGLPDKAKKNLFVPYAGGGERGGTGLGLAIVAELMIAHGGSAELEKSDTDGATFRLTLPGPAPK